MPIEAILIEGKPVPCDTCPNCGEPFEPFLRGQVARFDWFGLRKRIWCLICRACKEIVGHEEVKPPMTRQCTRYVHGEYPHEFNLADEAFWRHPRRKPIGPRCPYTEFTGRPHP